MGPDAPVGAPATRADGAAAVPSGGSGPGPRRRGGRRVIHAVAICPGPPVLLPDVAPALRAELDDLVAAGRAALRALDGADRVVVLAEGVPHPVRLDPTAPLPPSGVLRSAPAQPGTPALPVAAVVGAWWLAGWYEAAPPSLSQVTVQSPDGAGSSSCWDGPDRVGVLAIADGGTRHGEQAPGGPHPHADTHLTALTDALAAGDPTALASALDTSTADHDPPVAGSVWRALARLPAPDRSVVLFSAAPWGVGYVVASWSWCRPAAAPFAHAGGSV